MNVVIVNRQRMRKVNSRMLRKITVELLVELEVGKAELGINLVAAPEMTTLNETFLRHAGSTDVITFDYRVGQASRLSLSSQKEYGDRRDACPTLHGEIFICVDEAILQAKKLRTNWESEVVRYVVHGVLHLLDYDDSRAAARRRMKCEENRLLRRLSRRFSLAHLGGVTKLSA